MRAQLGNLIKSASRPNITIQVIPFEVGAHPGVESNFSILELPPPSPGVVFVEGLVGSIYLEKADDLDRYQKIFARLREIALSPQDSIGLIARLRG